MTKITALSSVREAREFLKQGYKDGVKCPCCEQWVKLYRRKITPSAARTLLELYRKRKDRVMVSELETHDGGGDFAKLVHWGLILENKDASGKPTGEWSITPRGTAFVTTTKFTVMKYALILNGALLAFDGPEVTIEDCLSGKFDYGELMS